MGFHDVIKNSVLEGFTSADISTVKMVVALGICLLISAYIYFVYRYVTRTTFYDRNFNVSMASISVIVTGIIIAMQSSLIISLGMVGALSIVRFRTAIKEPLDLLFLFWSIGTGIICGAGLYEVAVAVALVTTLGILFFQMIPISASPYLVVVNANDKGAETEIISIIKRYSPRYRIDSKNLRQSGMDLIVEIRSKNSNVLVDELSVVGGVSSVSLLYHDAPVKN
ncbi:DUF4956 domain-containing protein [Parablautia intestinalis]|uniref:DUF4956 domain-containing protein n=1 Tax=Parablautia intestinalis TaxID=2320100 RepID=UPI00256F58B4|nr:DUF4956 domain-containing protein [Parablautia intestinalis]